MENIFKGIPMTRIAAIIRENRIAAGLSQKQLAEAIHVSTRSITNYENGKTLPEAGVLASLLSVLHIDPKSVSDASNDSIDPFEMAINSAYRILAADSPYTDSQKQSFLIKIVQRYLSINSEKD